MLLLNMKTTSLVEQAFLYVWLTKVKANKHLKGLAVAKYKQFLAWINKEASKQ